MLPEIFWTLDEASTTCISAIMHIPELDCLCTADDHRSGATGFPVHGVVLQQQPLSHSKQTRHIYSAEFPVSAILRWRDD